jgi:hypothetical protein
VVDVVRGVECGAASRKAIVGNKTPSRRTPTKFLRNNDFANKGSTNLEVHLQSRLKQIRPSIPH